MIPDFKIGSEEEICKLLWWIKFLYNLHLEDIYGKGLISTGFLLDNLKFLWR